MKATLQENMSHKLITVPVGTSAQDAYHIMVSNMIRHLPVTEKTGHSIIGILSDRDLLRTPDPKMDIAELMTSPTLSFDLHAPVRNVVQSMVDKKMSAFLITEHNEVIGICTSEDMLILLSKLLLDEPSTKWILSEFLGKTHGATGEQTKVQ